jgi:hypothetical protein
LIGADVNPETSRTRGSARLCPALAAFRSFRHTDPACQRADTPAPPGACRAELRLPDGGELPFRITCVLHREEGEWKFVQSHASIGVANEQTVGRLPT